MQNSNPIQVSIIVVIRNKKNIRKIKNNQKALKFDMGIKVLMGLDEKVKS